MRYFVIIFSSVIVALLGMSILAFAITNRQEVSVATRPGSFADSPVICPPNNDITGIARFGEGITLTGVQALPDRVVDSLDLRVGWAITENVPRHTYLFSLHVMDSQDRLVTQTDYGLPQQPAACVSTHIDMSAFPLGTYTLQAIVYALDSGAHLPGVIIATGESVDTPVLGTFSVVR